jgi:uracil-DNA glycosylase family 4
MAERAKRKVLNLAAERRAKKDRKASKIINDLGGMYPLNAPGMPPPGPNFLRQAQSLGDDTVLEKATKTKEGTYNPGTVLIDLYRRALREPHFSMPIEVRAGQFRDASFVPGHIWGEHYDDWMASLSNPQISVKPVTGPHPADVMVVGKMPWKDETQEGRNFIGDTGRILLEMCMNLHIKGLVKWYVTNLVKYMPPDGTTNLKAGWIKDCLPILHQELRLVRPKYILFLGADASKEILGEKHSVSQMQGRLVEYTFPVHPSADCEPQTHTAKCMTVLHPANVARAQGPHEARQLERGLARFGLMLSGAQFDEEQGIDHRVCTSIEEAQEWVQEVAHTMKGVEPKYRILGIDAEWEGHHWCNSNAWIATVQVSWADKKSICFHLRNEDGKVVFRDADGKPAVKRLARLLTKHLNKYRIAGHFFVSDLEMLVNEGFDFRGGYFVPLEDGEDGTPAWQRVMNGEGGLDTAMMAHAIEETGMLGLESLAMRYTTAPRYDTVMEEAVTELCKQLGIKRAALEGYGKVRRDLLIPYGNYDADVTRRLAVLFVEMLSSDYDGNNCWEAFWESMIIQPVILEVHMNGMWVDRKRVDFLTVKFMEARSAMEKKIKESAKWPDPPDDPDDLQEGQTMWPSFNIRSVQHVKEYLFGEHLNGKVTVDGAVVRLRPPGAESLKVMPLLDTSKPPKRWADIVEAGKTREHSPSTGKATLALLAQENMAVAEKINEVRDYRFLDQVLKSMLRPPKEADDGSWLYEPDDGDLASQGLLVYDAGLVSCIDDDGMVRTHLYPTAETGRWKSARPNLQNISKTRDPDYERLLGKENYKHKLRGVFRTPPRGVSVPVVKLKKGKYVVEYEDDNDWVFVDADLKGAELYGMAVMSGSKKMIEHAKRSIDEPDEGYDISGKKKPDGHVCALVDGKKPKACELCGYPGPNYYDIHSRVAVMAFKLSCHPSKFGLGLAKKAHLRNIAKTVIFGLAYGRGAKAIALAAKEQRKPGEPEVTVEDAQAVIDAVFEMYPELVPFFAEARERALNQRWLCSCFGRFRRFPHASDNKLEGEFERQAMNFPIQSMIASLVDRWAATLHMARERLMPKLKEQLFQWQLQIHDALIVRAKAKYVPYIVKTLIPWSVKQIPVYPTKLDGTPIEGKGPYYLGSEIEVCEYWGEQLTKADCERLAIPAEFGKG